MKVLLGIPLFFLGDLSGMHTPPLPGFVADPSTATTAQIFAIICVLLLFILPKD